MKLRHKGIIALAFVVMELSLWSIFLKIGGSSIGLIPELFYGFLVGLIVSLAVSLALGRLGSIVSMLKDRNTLLLILVVGLFNNAFTQLSLGVGTLGTNPSIGAIVYRSWIIILAILTPSILRQKINRAQIAATVIGFLGIYVVFSGGTLFNLNISEAPAIGMLIVSAICTAIAALFMNRYTFDQFNVVVLFNLSSLVLIGLLAVTTNTNLNVAFTPSSAISILFLGIFAYGIGTGMVYYSFRVLGPLLVGNVIILVPFITIVLSALIASTPIALYYLAAALLISAGVVLQRKYSGLPKRITKSRKLDKLFVFDVTSAFAGNSGHSIRSSTAGGNRAFAVKFSDSRFDEKLYSPIFVRHNCIVFTSAKPHDEVKPEEIEFVNKVMDIKKGDIALIGMGNPDRLEASFEEFLRVPGVFQY